MALCFTKGGTGAGERSAKVMKGDGGKKKTECLFVFGRSPRRWTGEESCWGDIYSTHVLQYKLCFRRPPSPIRPTLFSVAPRARFVPLPGLVRRRYAVDRLFHLLRLALGYAREFFCFLCGTRLEASRAGERRVLGFWGPSWVLTAMPPRIKAYQLYFVQ